MKSLSFILLLTSLLAACGQTPKKIEAVGPSTVPENLSHSNHTASAPAPTMHNSDLHQVKALEVLVEGRYTYAKVQEGSNAFWIATKQGTIQVGDDYFYRGGLLKTNYQNQALGRTFDSIYLVSQVVSSNHGSERSGQPIAMHSSHGHGSLPDGLETVSIAEIVGSPEKYAGQQVTVGGKCVKVNPGIMERNWIHLQDGTKDDFDFVLTTTSSVPVGQMVAFEGTITVDKDFGAGYHYEIIMENARTIK